MSIEQRFLSAIEEICRSNIELRWLVHEYDFQTNVNVPKNRVLQAYLFYGLAHGGSDPLPLALARISSLARWGFNRRSIIEARPIRQEEVEPAYAGWNACLGQCRTADNHLLWSWDEAARSRSIPNTKRELTCRLVWWLTMRLTQFAEVKKGGIHLILDFSKASFFKDFTNMFKWRSVKTEYDWIYENGFPIKFTLICMIAPSSGLRALLITAMQMAPSVLQERLKIVSDWEAAIKWAGNLVFLSSSVAFLGFVCGLFDDLFFGKDVIGVVLLVV